MRYSSDGALSVARWNGFDMAAASADGVQASFADGVLTVTIQRPALAGASTFGITGLSSRLQTVAGTRLVASDFVPDTGSNVFSPPGPKAFPDSEGDQDMAPDISTISVSDGQNGTIAFRVTTANYRVLGADKLVGLGFELVGRPADSDEVFITYQGGPEESIIIERELEGFLTQDTPPDRATARFDDGVLTIDVHRTELDDVARFRFGVVTADLVGDAEGEDDDSLGDIESVDFSPEELQPEMLHRYALEHRPPVRLTVGRPSGLPTVPRSGKAFTVRVVVTRSDTGTAVRSGTVSCNAFVGKARVVAKGRFRAGRAQCSLVVPARHRSNRVRGTMTIRAAGASVRSGFSFVVG